MLRMEIALFLVVAFVAYMYFTAEKEHTALHKTFSVLLVAVLVHLALDGCTVYTVNHLDTVPMLLNGALHRLLSLLRSGRTLLGSCRLRLCRGSLLRHRRAGLCRRFRLRGLGLWLGGRFCLGLIRVGTEFAEDIVKVEAVIFIAHFSPSSQFTVPPVRALSMAEFGMIYQSPLVYSSSTSKAVVV